MKQRKPSLAAFTAIIGMLAFILTVSVLAEKAHEAHLPERSGRANQEELNSSGISLGIVLLLSAVFGFARQWNGNKSGTAKLSGQSGCTVKTMRFATGWPMRRHYS